MFFRDFPYYRKISKGTKNGRKKLDVGWHTYRGHAQRCLMRPWHTDRGHAQRCLNEPLARQQRGFLQRGGGGTRTLPRTKECFFLQCFQHFFLFLFSTYRDHSSFTTISMVPPLQCHFLFFHSTENFLVVLGKCARSGRIFSPFSRSTVLGFYFLPWYRKSRKNMLFFTPPVAIC